MNTTVRTSTKRIQVLPNASAGNVEINIFNREGEHLAGATLTPDEVGALLFGIECAAEAAGIAQDRAAA
jgi:hypothetical protein